MMTGCGCRGTVHEPHCGYWRTPKMDYPFTITNSPEKVNPEQEVLVKLDRIIALLETIARRAL